MATIQYISIGDIEQHNDTFTSILASLRYRILIPAQHLSRRHNIQIIHPPAKTDTWPLEFINNTSSDILIFSKTLHHDNENLAKARRHLGQTVVLDVCDNYFDHLHHGEKWRSHFITMCHLATHIIASTENLADAIKHYTGRDAIVISDPIEGIKNSPTFAPTFPRLKLLWFGHPTNGMSLINILDDLLTLSQTTPLLLTVVTGAFEKFEKYLQDFNQQHGSILPISIKPWSVETTWQSINACDLVIIPTSLDEFSRAKSPNRLIESLWGGRFVVANAIPSYQSYAPFCWLGEKISDGIRYAINNPAAVQQQIKQGQDYISAHHSPYIIANAWEHALGIATASTVKLNLGCGDKILPDYINIDIVSNRKGMEPDIICDLHRLTPFASNSVDEILSVHVVEHFWRWEVRDVLKEWIRVLKPGGKIILECPNLESACRYFLENPDLHSKEDKNGQRSMWVFYGDPSWKDPYMVHRWGYTPSSLAELLREIGFENIKQEPAEYKLREPRDMRITGIKPT